MQYIWFAKIYRLQFICRPFVFFTIAWECNFSATDGTGASETIVGTGVGSSAACAALVRSTQPTANGVTYGTSGTNAQKCYAEFGMTGQTASSAYASCFFVLSYS